MRQGRAAVLMLVLAAVGAATTVPDAAAAPRAAKPKVSLRVIGKPIVGTPVQFKISVKAPAGRRIKKFTLSLGDGSRMHRGKKPRTRVRHVYPRAGTFRARLVVTDSSGRQASARVSVRVRPRPTVPARPAPAPPLPTPTPSPSPSPTPSPTPTPTPPARLAVDAEVSVQVGSQVTIAALPPFTLITALGPPPASPVSATLSDGQIAVSAPAGADPGTHRLDLKGTGCTATACELPFDATITVDVQPLAAPAGAVDEFSIPSPDRVDAATALPTGGATLNDELLVTIGSPVTPGDRAEADTIADTAGGVISGGIEELGVYEVRWEEPQDLAARTQQLLTNPTVAAVSDSHLGIVGEHADPPGDWDGHGTEVTWPFDQVRARDAWDVTTGTDVTVGVIDGGSVFVGHEDLRGKVLGSDPFDDHATHVAGLACARANGIGVVGMAWGCPVVSAGMGEGTDKTVLEAATRVAKEPGVKVANISLGYPTDFDPSGGYCATPAQHAAIIRNTSNAWPMFRQLFRGSGNHVVWTVSAGNACARGVHSPWGANFDLDNVITVGATNSDRSLARFSNFGDGVEVAAPGGVKVPGFGGSSDPVGLLSTMKKPCGGPNHLTCSIYGIKSGTSMAAPVVAGIVALVRSAHPGYTAAEAARCVTRTAGQDVGMATEQSLWPGWQVYTPLFTYTPDELPIVNAAKAVACDYVDPHKTASYTGSWTGNWIMHFAEEAPDVLGAVNDAPTYYSVGGCFKPPGTKILSGLVPNGPQWNGNILGVACATGATAWIPVAAMRAVERQPGVPTLVMAWIADGVGSPPVIDAVGGVSAGRPYHKMELARPNGMPAARSGAAIQLHEATLFGASSSPAPPGASLVGLRPPIGPVLEPGEGGG